jgi:hypothetical protein
VFRRHGLDEITRDPRTQVSPAVTGLCRARRPI